MNRTSDSHPLRSRLPRIVPTLLVFGTALVLTVWSFLFVRHHERARIQAEIDRMAHHSVDDVQRVVDRYLEVLESIRALYAASEIVERDEFASFAGQQLARHEGIDCLLWLPRVPAAQLDNWVDAARQDGLVDFQIFRHESAESGPVGDTGDRFPVFYAEPLSNVDDLLGCDFAGEMAYQHALQQARTSGGLCAAKRVVASQQSGSPVSWVVFVPIYQNRRPALTVEQRQNHLLGYAAAIFRTVGILEETLRRVESDLMIRLDEGLGPSKANVLYESEGWGELGKDTDGGSGQPFTLQMADRTWFVRYHPTRAYLARCAAGSSWAILVGGLVAAILLSGLVYRALGRTERIEMLVRQRTAQLEKLNQDLVDAKRVADSANRAKSDLLANVSHEIRTPMNGVIGMAELLAETDLTAKQQEYLDLIGQSADLLLRLLNGILDLSKIEAGKLEIEATDFALRDLVGKTMQTMELRANHKGLTLDFRVDPLLPDLFVGDPVRLRQILINLVDNAIKFTDHGGVVVNVEQEWCEDDKYGLHFSVQDTGIGIPQDKQQTIFRAFEQADGSTTRRYGGSGLGLAITQQLVKMMSGELTLNSEVGQGSTFHFTIALTLSQAREPLETHAAARTSGTPASVRPGPSLRVLLAEDGVINQRVVRELLTRQGHLVTTVGDGEEAIDAVSKGQFDLVLMDVQMPRMDGFQATAQIRAKESETGEHLPIVAMTASAMRGDRERCLEAGMDSYISKPVDPQQLSEVVDQYAPVPPSGTSHPADPAEVGRTDAASSAAQPFRSIPGVLDLEQASRRIPGDRETVVEMAKLLLEECPRLLEEIRESVANGDAHRLRRAAHTLKSAADVFGAQRVQAIACQLEIMGRDGELSGAEQSVAHLTSEVERLISAVGAL